MADGLSFTNGIMLSADRKKLYYNATFTATHVFDVQPDLALANERLRVDKVNVDGMALDAQGNHRITGFRSNEITRGRPDGTALPPVTTPADAITQIRFGGADASD